MGVKWYNPIVIRYYISKDYNTNAQLQGGEMREICDNQLRFEFYQSNSKMSKKLEKISEILEKDRSFLHNVAKDFKTPKESTSGAKGMTIEQVVRVSILKQLCKFTPPDLGKSLNIS